jgi:2-haloacid dehalogenase
MAKYDFVLLDADNTLLDFDAAESRALHAVLAERGFSVTQDLLNRYHAINQALWERFNRGEVEQDWLVVERFAILLRELGSGLDPAEVNRDYLEKLGSISILLPGALELCQALAPACTLAIVTNGTAHAQRGRIEPSPLRPLLDYVFISGELGVRKPQPAFFDLVRREMGIADPSRAVVVGDNLHTDILGGINAGMDTIWYNPHGNPGDPAIVPTWQVSSLRDIAPLILS